MTASPSDWRDQFLYFLLPDRFSDGQEEAARRPLFDRDHPTYARIHDRAAWLAAARRPNGGTLRGVRGKLPYLRSLGVSTVWLGPVWKQRSEISDNPGYGVQNFLDVDPRFGNTAELRALADALHERGMHLILDIIVTHTGNNWFYHDADGHSRETMPYKTARHDFAGWRDQQGKCSQQITTPEDGVWPRELQDPTHYTRKGCPEGHVSTILGNEGDLGNLKELDLHRETTLDTLIRIWCSWIVRSDCDGFHIDTLGSLPPAVVQRFCTEIRHFAASRGKEEFLLLGEEVPAAGPFHGSAAGYPTATDAFLDRHLCARTLDTLLAGDLEPQRLFALFDHAHSVAGVAGGGRFRIAFMDQRDLIATASGATSREERYLRLAQVTGALLTLPILPALHFGAEQALIGSGNAPGASRDGSDRFLREAMFGGPFGPFETTGCHFFDTTHPTFLRTAAIGRLRTGSDPIGLALRRGQFFPRETSILQGPFAIHGAGELVAWSRLFRDREVLVVINTHAHETRGAEITIDAGLHPPGQTLRTLYRSDWPAERLRMPSQTADTTPGEEDETVLERQGRSVVHLSLPPTGLAILG